jgi:hypothetical protein
MRSIQSITPESGTSPRSARSRKTADDRDSEPAVLDDDGEEAAAPLPPPPPGMGKLVDKLA